MNLIIEGQTKLLIETKQIVDKKMPIFYNPVMSTNRDISLLFLQALEKNELTIADPLAGSGIRSLRILKELNENVVKKIVINDIKLEESSLYKNLEINNINLEKIIIKKQDANQLLNSEGHFDYIDLDPFGSPNQFLDSAIRALKRNAFLAITATDTSALCGSYPLACIRKYWAVPLRNELMHEFAVRILIRKIQLIGAQHEKALIPKISYAKEHYVRIFFQAFNNKKMVDEILKNQDYYIFKNEKKGPIWRGKINDTDILNQILKKTQTLEISKKTLKLLEMLKQESEINELFFFDVHELASQHKIKILPKLEKIIETLKKQEFQASRTHFNVNAIKTNAPIEKILRIIKT